MGIGTTDPTTKLDVDGQVRIRGGAPGVGKVLTSDADGVASWEDAPSTGGGGTVTNVTGTAPIQVADGNDEPVISIDDASTTAKGAVQVSATGGISVSSGVLSLPDVVTGGSFGSSTEIPSLTVDDKGRITAISNNSISVDPAGKALLENYVWIGNNSNVSVARHFGVGDLRNSSGNQQIPGACTSSDTMTWSSLTDQFSCTPISIEVSQVSDFPTLGTAAAKDFGTDAGDVVELDGDGKIPSSLLPAGLGSKWTENSGDIYRSTGKVGIGITNPGVKLQIDAGTSAGSQLWLQSNSNSEIASMVSNTSGATTASSSVKLQTTGANGYLHIINGAAGADLFNDRLSVVGGFNASGVSVVATSAGSDVRFGTANAERMRIDSDGNVGIGTIGPTTKLDVDGQVRIRGGAPGVGKVLTSDADGVASWADAPSGGGSPGGSTTHIQYNDSGSFAGNSNFTYDNTNKTLNLGSTGSSQIRFGTSEATITGNATNETITVYGNVKAMLYSFVEVLIESVGHTSIWSADETIFKTGLGKDERMRISTTGNVGIGQTNPTTKLHIQGTSGNTLRIVDGNQGAGKILTSDANGVASWQDPPSGGGGGGDFMADGSVPMTGNLDLNGYELVSSGGDVRIGNGGGGAIELLGLAKANDNIDLNGYELVSSSGDVRIGNGGGVIELLGLAKANYNIDLNGYDLMSSSGEVRIGDGSGSIYISSPVGIGTSAAPSEMLEVDGNVLATSFISTSDERLKSNIDTEKGLDTVLRLRGVNYNWTSSGIKESGVIAQEVEKIMPWAVVTNVDSGYKAVKYQNLIAPLIESTKELYQLCTMSEGQMEALSQRSAQISREVASLKDRVDHLEKENAALKESLKSLMKRMDAIESAK